MLCANHQTRPICAQTWRGLKSADNLKYKHDHPHVNDNNATNSSAVSLRSEIQKAIFTLPSDQIQQASWVQSRKRYKATHLLTSQKK